MFYQLFSLLPHGVNSYLFRSQNMKWELIDVIFHSHDKRNGQRHSNSKYICNLQIINVTSQKQHAIQCNFVIATNTIEKIIIGKLTNSCCCNSGNCKSNELTRKIVRAYLVICIKIGIE